MPYKSDPERRPAYDAAEKFVKRALENDDSLFTPGTPIWSKKVLEDLKARFIDRPDTSTDAFEVKLKRQLDGAPPSTIQLAAEVIFLYLLPATQGSAKAETKRQLIEQVLSWSSQTVALPDWIDSVLESGIAKMGTAFNTYRPFQLQLIIVFVLAWKDLSADERTRCLKDAWEFKRLLFNQPLHAAQTQREALLHLIHPVTFEPIVSYRAKQRISEQFARLVDSDLKDVDRQLQQIRERLVEEQGEFGHFYEPKIKALWQPDASPWGRFINWAKRFHEDSSFDDDERTYKLEVGERMTSVRAELLAGSEWREPLKKVFSSSNLTAWRAHWDFLEWCEANEDQAVAALRELWSGDGEVSDRVGRFADTIIPAVPGMGSRLSIASVLAMGNSVSDHPPYRVTRFDRAYELTRSPRPDKDASAAATYAHAMDFLDRLSLEATARGLDLRDRLDAQSVLWAVVQNDLPDHAKRKERDALEKYRGGAPLGDDDDDPVTIEETLESLAAELFLDVDFLRKTEKLIKDKGQVIFHGPPGTGKTYVAQQIAAHFAGGAAGVSLVQFHPSYAYEDFVEGYRPAPPVEGKPGFILRDGPLKRAARAAAAEPDKTFILIIDEINRGNVAKVFGELYFLLEYRDRGISLQYSTEEFTLPDNLWLIGTMNTADRSIALVDAALRRRFHFLPFFPDEAPIEGLLRRWLQRHKPEMIWIADALDAVNRDLADRNLAVGPSHFLRKDLDDEWVELIWQHSVMPYLEEQLFGEHERLADFTFDRLRNRVAKAKEPVDSGGKEPSDAPDSTD